MDDLKLLSRSEDDLENEIKIVKAICTDINMNFGLENCARICLQKWLGTKQIYMQETHFRIGPREKHFSLQA
jgi:hypothetical protein